MSPMAIDPPSPPASTSGTFGVSLRCDNGIDRVNGSDGSDGTNGARCSPKRPCHRERDSQDISRPAPSMASSQARSYREEPISNGIQHAQSHRIRSLGIHEEEAGGPRSRSHANIHTYADDTRSKAFPRIAKPVELMRSSYDVVVIGSGYGGGVAASRMARCEDADGKRQSVCVLERGNEKWPGEYPSGTLDALNEVHVSGEFSPSWFPSTLVQRGDPTGMYHMIFGKGLNTIVCNALGGTSLINANVFLEADKDTLSMPVWPEEIRRNPSSLDKYYHWAKQVLQPTEYPDDWPDLPKVELFKKQAAALGMAYKWRKVPQTTRFRNGPNSTGVEMSPSALTGQDATGVNDGSKNSTLVTYLADAWNWGAEMFCECEVRYIKKAEDREGYIIYFAWHGRNRGQFKSNLHGDLMWVHAKKCVFFGAGAIGTTEILLRSKEMGLPLSDHIGQGMSGNGDMLAFGYNTDFEANAIGKPYPNPYNPIGPTINSVIDCREGHNNPLDGFVIEEGAIPRALAPFLQTLLEMMPGNVSPKNKSLSERVQASLARYKSCLLGAHAQGGSLDNTQVYLVMSHDSSQAMLTLKNDKPVLEFLGVGGSDQVKALHQLLARATEAVGGTFVHNPFYALLGGQQVTVHPIGGACMARDGTASTGSTTHDGELFTGNEDETHDGLIVTDAAVIPAALGVNPFATITALAERSVDLYIQKHDMKIHEKRNGILDLFGEPKFAPKVSGAQPFDAERRLIEKASHRISRANAAEAPGFGFTEVMSGFIHRDNGLAGDKRRTYELAYRTAQSLCESSRFFLSVQSFNTRQTVKEPDHAAMLTGTFVCPTIAGSPFMVQRGDFNLFVLDQKAPGTKNLTYDFDMRGVDGKILHFHGYKVVDSSVALAPLQFWRATSMLYVTIFEPGRHLEPMDDCEEPWRHGKVVAKGIMHIQPSDFISQIMTMTPTGSGLLKKAYSAASFLSYFTRKSLSLFLTPFTPLQYPSVTYTGYINDTPPDASFVIVARDGVKSRMHMWESTNTDLETRNVIMIPGAAVDHQIFTLPTIPFNAVNYLTRAGYRVFIPVHRIGQLMIAQNNWTTYDARQDLRACLEYIREHDGYSRANAPGNKIYAVSHCMGSVSFSTGLLDGTIPASWILGITASQVFMNPVWSPGNMAKVRVPVPLDGVYRRLIGNWFSCSTSRDDGVLQRCINELLRFYPEERRELCNSASCHRCTLVFGRCWNHANLNEATHRQIDRFFGGVNMTQLQLLMKQGFEGHVMTNGPLFERLTTERNVRRLMGVPVMMFVGGDNAVLSTEATERTYETLCEAFGRHGGGDDGVMYRRRIIPGYGHLDCWMGRQAWKDVYPLVREEIDRVVRGEGYRFEEPDDRFAAMAENGDLLY